MEIMLQHVQEIPETIAERWVYDNGRQKRDSQNHCQTRNPRREKCIAVNWKMRIAWDPLMLYNVR